MVNLSAFNDVPDFVLNESLINDSTEIMANIATNTNNMSEGYFGIFVLLILFFFTLYLLMKDDDIFRLDFLRSLVFSSFFTTSVGVILLVTGFIGEIRHVIWFAVVFLVSLILSWEIKRKGL